MAFTRSGTICIWLSHQKSRGPHRGVCVNVLLFRCVDRSSIDVHNLYFDASLPISHFPLESFRDHSAPDRRHLSRSPAQRLSAPALEPAPISKLRADAAQT